VQNCSHRSRPEVPQNEAPAGGGRRNKPRRYGKPHRPRLQLTPRHTPEGAPFPASGGIGTKVGDLRTPLGVHGHQPFKVASRRISLPHGDISGTLIAALEPKSLRLLATGIACAALDRRHQRRRQASREASPGPQKNKREGLCPPFCALCGVPHSTPAIRSPGFSGRRPFWHRRGVGHIPSPPVSRTLPSRQPVNIACRHRRGARPRRQRQCFVNINRAPAPAPRGECPARHAPCSTLRYAADPARRCPIQGRMRRSRARAGSRFS